MAKSKSGGTRSYIRGKIGADVYSIGKDGKGNRQQVVRSLAEQVSNPQTESQMFGRMIMSTVMQAVSAFRTIIDHSFDGLPAGQPSISEFIRRNYALIRTDALAHPSSSNTFGLVKYQQKGIKAGPYIISKGDVAVPSTYSQGSMPGYLNVAVNATGLTFGGLKTYLGIDNEDDYITLVCCSNTQNWVRVVRIHLDMNHADTDAVSTANIDTFFSSEGNVGLEVELSGNEVSFYIASGSPTFGGFILSKKVAGVWKHSECILSVDGTTEFTADVALPTYPQGNARFLNGGDL